MRSVDARLIQLVARRYREMQGLMTVCWGMFPVLAVSSMFIGSNDTVMLWHVIGCLVCFVAWMIWVRPRIAAYYSARFGRVSPAFSFLFTPMMFQGLSVNSALTLYHLPTVVPCVVIFLLLGGWPAWIVVRDWPYRAYWGLPLAAALGAAFPLASGSHDDFTMAVSYVSFGIAVAVAGTGDHLLLVRTLRPASQAEEIDQAQTPEGSA